MSRLYTIFAEGVWTLQYEKLKALCSFGGHDQGTFAGMILGKAIDDAWEGYRDNPKHRHQILAWEKDRMPNVEGGR